MKHALMAMAAFLAVSGCTSLEDRLGLNIPTYVADLQPAAGITSTGSADGIMTLDTKTNELGYTINYKGLSSTATMAHIHGPADPGANAGVVVPLAAPTGTQVVGKVILTEAQVAELNAGRYYVNIHTETNKGGEIRGTLKLFVIQ